MTILIRHNRLTIDPSENVPIFCNAYDRRLLTSLIGLPMELRASLMKVRCFSLVSVIILWTIIARIYLSPGLLVTPSTSLIARLALGERKCHSDFQTIEDGTAFVYSAYIDDRPARDVDVGPEGNRAVVRVFVYFLRTINVKRDWRCMFWYKGQEDANVTTIAGITDLNELKELRFLVAMVICNLPKDPPDYLLQGISLGKDGNLSNFVCIQDLRQMTPKPNNQSSVQVTPNDKGCASKYCSNKAVSNFTVCTTPIYGSYYQINDIVNFIEVSRIFGAQKFIFYVDADLDPTIIYCLESYSQQGIVEMYPFTPPVHDGLHYHGQIISISECIYRTMYRTKYLINQDIDEVIVPLKADGWQAMIDKINSRQSNPDRIAAYNFRNQFFPMQAPDDKRFNQNFLVKRYDIKTLLKTGKDGYIYPHDDRSKVMARPERVLIWHVHFIQRRNLVRKEDDNWLVSESDGLLYHYRIIGAYKNNSIRETRMHSWADVITDRVHSGIGICRTIDYNLHRN